MVVNFKVAGIIGATKALDRIGKEIKEGMVTGVDKATFFLQGEVKQSIAGRKAETKSVDTGRLLNSVEAKTSKFNGFVLSNLSYAPYIEYGTTRIPARRHFRNSRDRSRGKIRDFIGGSIKTRASKKFDIPKIPPL